MIYPKNFESRIGFDTIRKEIAKLCVSPLGNSCCEAMAFSFDFNLICKQLTQTREFLSILESKREFPINNYHDLRLPLKAIATPGSFMTAQNLFELRRSLDTINAIIKFFAPHDDEPSPYPNLAELTHEMNAFPAITAEIDRILDKKGDIKDTASPALFDLRSQLNSVNASLNNIMRRVISSGKENGYLEPDTTPTVRDGRLVLPVSPMYKRKIKGIVHDESATGKTVFIEPEEIVVANNMIREVESEIKREIVRILIAVSDIIRPEVKTLERTFAILGTLDFIRAKARFAALVGGDMPNMHPAPVIEWYHAVHPSLFLSLKEQGKEVVPLNIELNTKQRILIISGPNAGGKSVCLKTVGVVQYMMQCGVLPPLYSNSHMGIFKNLFIDIGDQQSIEDDLSTYSSHLQNMKFFLNRGNRHTLLLIDEFGSGTEPQIGGAIAQSLLAEFNNKHMMGVITTHYQNLKHFAEDTQGIANAAMLYDRQHMKPLFQLSIGYPGSSFAIEIARNIGLPPEIINNAAEIVGSDYVNLDKYLLDIVRDRKYWENKRYEIHNKEKQLDQIISDYNSRIDEIKQQYRTIIKDAKSEAREILSQSNAQIERTIKDIKTAQAQKEKTREIRSQLDEFKQRLQDDKTSIDNHPLLAQPKTKKKLRTNKKKDAVEKPQDHPIEVGDNVIIIGSNTVGTVMSTDEKYSVVAFGNIKTRIETSKLQRTMRQATKNTAETPTLS
ncbi:MAG: endonuclease MutS2, partial [Muribaculaceae bacterium]|nr:endonuclease MutS2 [Muribaculaceae bacterium]